MIIQKTDHSSQFFRIIPGGPDGIRTRGAQPVWRVVFGVQIAKYHVRYIVMAILSI